MKTYKKIFILALIILCSFLFLADRIMGQAVYENGNITKDTILIKEATVTASYLATKNTPFSFTNIDSKEIDFRLDGSEPAVLLSHTPSVTYYSDNGLGSGYIYYRIRGIDQSRINSTLNGVPMNEPEDQGIYYNNYPDFLSSVGNVQIIRGVGLSKSGVSSYGGSINFQSKEFSDKFNVDIKMLMGSYGTSQAGMSLNGKSLYIKGSTLTTKGFKHNTFNDSHSIFYGAKSNNFKFHGFIGKQKNGMGWLGESIDNINKDPKYNSNKPYETDEFLYVHNQIQWNKWGASTTLYHTYLDGWYDTDIAHFDPTLEWEELINRIDLESNWLGLILNHRLTSNELNIDYGSNFYTYYRDHKGLFNGEQDYKNTGYKKEISPYIKAEYKVARSTLYGDVQYRYSIFSYDGSQYFPKQKYKFLNWSLGITYRTGINSQIYYGLGKSNREPTRTDLFMGWDNFDPDFYAIVEPESVIDNELGFKYFGYRLNLNTNLYHMNFTNEIVLNGQYGPNAILLHQNAAKSFRSGVEIDMKYRMLNNFSLLCVSNFSNNKIKQDEEKFDPVLTPQIISSLDVLYESKTLFVGVNTRYNGESYIDFSNESILPSYYTLNAYIGLTFYEAIIKLNLNNLTNELVLANAIMGWDMNPLYYVSAGRNFIISIHYNIQ